MGNGAHNDHLPSTANARLDLVCIWREKSRQPGAEQRHEFVLAAEGQHGSGQMDAKQRQPRQGDEREQHHTSNRAHDRKPVQNPCGRDPDAESRDRQERKQQRLPGMQRRQTMPAQKQSGQGADPRQEISQDAEDARRAESVVRPVRQCLAVPTRRRSGNGTDARPPSGSIPACPSCTRLPHSGNGDGKRIRRGERRDWARRLPE